MSDDVPHAQILAFNGVDRLPDLAGQLLGRLAYDLEIPRDGILNQSARFEVLLVNVDRIGLGTVGGFEDVVQED